MKQFILGMDIGYSNLKLEMGFKDEEPKTMVISIWSRPAEGKGLLELFRLYAEYGY